MATRELTIDRVDEMLGEIQDLVKAVTWSPHPAVDERLHGYRRYFEQVAQESGLRRQMLEAIAIVESAVRPWTKNPEKPAYGLMQIWGPVWFGEPLELPNGPSFTVDATNWSHPLPNLRAGAAILLRYGAGPDEDVGWWEVLNRYNGDRPPRDSKYEDDVETRYLALLRRDSSLVD